MTLREEVLKDAVLNEDDYFSRREVVKIIDEFARKRFFGDLGAEEMANVRQKVLRLPDLHLNQKMFSRKLDKFSQVVKIYFDDFGKIRRVYESK